MSKRPSTFRFYDIVYLFRGGHYFGEQFPVEADFDLQPYNTRCKTLPPFSRRPLAESFVADEDIDANVNSVMARIREFCVGRLETIGQVCLLGRSSGCQLALALAARLNKEGVGLLTFVGVSDVPMFDTGRIPPVKLVGDFKPLKGPIGSGAVAPTPYPWDRYYSSPLPKPQTEIPLVKLEYEIKAKTKINQFQTQGNHMKYAGSVKRWMWWSNTSAHEVHGKLDGDFENRLCYVRPRDFSLHNREYNFHVDLNTGEHWKKMCQEAATAFADFPPDAQ